LGLVNRPVTYGDDDLLAALAGEPVAGRSGRARRQSVTHWGVRHLWWLGGRGPGRGP
jgi:hypothetical protein